MDFGQRLKELRIKHELTQQEVATFLKVGRATIAGYETKNKQPDFEKTKLLARYFNVSVDFLLGNDDAYPDYDARILGLPNDKKRILDMVLQELERSDREQSAVRE